MMCLLRITRIEFICLSPAVAVAHGRRRVGGVPARTGECHAGSARLIKRGLAEWLTLERLDVSSEQRARGWWR